jgi:hypothetical protein
MSDLSDFDAPKKPWLTALIPASVILLAAGAYWAFTSGETNGNNGIEHGIPANTGDRLIPGKSYYLYASEIELYPSNQEGKSWDRGEDGPDIKYQIKWLGNEIFESTVKEDSLLGNWSGLQIDLKWSDLLGKTISPNEAIQAARIRYETKSSIEIVIKDSDLAKDDLAGNIEIDLKSLRVGKNSRQFPKDGGNSVRNLILTLLPIDSTIDDLAQFMRE